MTKINVRKLSKYILDVKLEWLQFRNDYKIGMITIYGATLSHSITDIGKYPIYIGKYPIIIGKNPILSDDLIGTIYIYRNLYIW